MPKRRFRWRFLPSPAQVPPGALSMRAGRIYSTSLGFNMWKGSRAYGRLIASYFRPTGKTGKLTAQYIAGMFGERWTRREPANKRARERGTTDRVDTINRGHRRDPSSATKASSRFSHQKKKNCRAHHRSSRLSAPHPFESAQPTIFPLHITISATCSPGNNRFTGRIRAELALYTRRG